MAIALVIECFHPTCDGGERGVAPMYSAEDFFSGKDAADDLDEGASSRDRDIYFWQAARGRRLWYNGIKQ